MGVQLGGQWGATKLDNGVQLGSTWGPAGVQQGATKLDNRCWKIQRPSVGNEHPERHQERNVGNGRRDCSFSSWTEPVPLPGKARVIKQLTESVTAQRERGSGE